MREGGADRENRKGNTIGRVRNVARAGREFVPRQHSYLCCFHVTTSTKMGCACEIINKKKRDIIKIKI